MVRRGHEGGGRGHTSSMARVGQVTWALLVGKKHQATWPARGPATSLACRQATLHSPLGCLPARGRCPSILPHHLFVINLLLHARPTAPPNYCTYSTQNHTPHGLGAGAVAVQWGAPFIHALTG